MIWSYDSGFFCPYLNEVSFSFNYFYNSNNGNPDDAEDDHAPANSSSPGWVQHWAISGTWKCDQRPDQNSLEKMARTIREISRFPATLNLQCFQVGLIKRRAVYKFCMVLSCFLSVRTVVQDLVFSHHQRARLKDRTEKWPWDAP